MKPFLLFLSVVSALTGTQASAQQETEFGSRIMRPSPAEPDYRSKLSKGNQARAMVDDFALCTLQYSRKAVASALALTPGDTDSHSSLNKLAQPRCLRDATLRMPPELLRGALFRAKLLDEFVDRRLVFAAQPLDPTRFAHDLENRQQVQHALLQDFASCVVRAKPAAAAAFVTEEAGSKKEQKALDDLGPALGPCLSNGQKIKLSRDVLGAQLAEALYHELVAEIKDEASLEASE